MTKNKEKLLETFNKTFPDLTDENKSSILDMTKFLVMTQNSVIPSMLENHGKKEDRKGN
jgi:hypothetical protein